MHHKTHFIQPLCATDEWTEATHLDWKAYFLFTIFLLVHVCFLEPAAPPGSLLGKEDLRYLTRPAASESPFLQDLQMVHKHIKVWEALLHTTLFPKKNVARLWNQIYPDLKSRWFTNSNVVLSNLLNCSGSQFPQQLNAEEIIPALEGHHGL